MVSQKCAWFSAWFTHQPTRGLPTYWIFLTHITDEPSIVGGGAKHILEIDWDDDDSVIHSIFLKSQEVNVMPVYYVAP